MVIMYWYIIFVLDSGPPKGSLNSLGGHPVIIRCYISKSWFPDRFTTWVEEGDGQQTLLKRRSSSFLLLLLLSPLPGSSIVVTIHLLTLCEQTTTSQLPNVFDMALLNSSAGATTFYGFKKKAPLCLLTYSLI